MKNLYLILMIGIILISCNEKELELDLSECEYYNTDTEFRVGTLNKLWHDSISGFTVSSYINTHVYNEIDSFYFTINDDMEYEFFFRKYYNKNGIDTLFYYDEGIVEWEQGEPYLYNGFTRWEYSYTLTSFDGTVMKKSKDGSCANSILSLKRRLYGDSIAVAFYPIN